MSQCLYFYKKRKEVPPLTKFDPENHPFATHKETRRQGAVLAEGAASGRLPGPRSRPGARLRRVVQSGGACRSAQSSIRNSVSSFLESEVQTRRYNSIA